MAQCQRFPETHAGTQARTDAQEDCNRHERDGRGGRSCILFLEASLQRSCEIMGGTNVSDGVYVFLCQHGFVGRCVVMKKCQVLPFRRNCSRQQAHHIYQSETVHDRKYIIYITVSAVLGIAHVLCRPFKISVLFNPLCVWVLF